jgi:hypothetical protein
MARDGRWCNPLRELRADCACVRQVDRKAAIPVSGGMDRQSVSAPRREADRFRVNSFQERAGEHIQAEQDPCCSPALSVGQKFC